MKRHTRRAPMLGLLLLTVFVHEGQAFDETSLAYQVYGAGTLSCRFVGTETVEGRAINHWLSGFLTGVNMVGRTTYDILGGSRFATAQEWLSQYCRANPGQPVSEAARDLFFAFLETRQQTEPVTVLPPRPSQRPPAPAPARVPGKKPKHS